MLLCGSINSVEVIESPLDLDSDDDVVVDSLSDSVVDSCSPTPAIKGSSSSEWVVNFPRWRRMKESLSGMWQGSPRA